jgi:hypothetical protein
VWTFACQQDKLEIENNLNATSMNGAIGIFMFEEALIAEHALSGTALEISTMCLCCFRFEFRN